VSFPATALPALTELLIDGAWTAAIVREESGVAITRGRRDERSRVAPSQLSATLDNRSGDYSNRLPTAAYYGKLGRNTQLRHRIRWVRDPFSRTSSSSWGTSDDGAIAWVNSGGSASDYNVAAGVGTHTLTSAAVTRASHFAMPVQAPDLVATVSASAVATGDHFYEEVMFGVDGNNCYNAQLQLRTGGTVWLSLMKVVAGVAGTIVAAAQVGTYSAGTQWTVRLQRTPVGYVRAAAWLTSTNPTSITWTMTSSTPETEVTDFSTGFLRSTSGPANTNVNPVLSWDDFEVNSYRFWGEVPSWPQTWDTSGRDVTAPIEAAGIMRRLGTSTKPLLSALTRAMLGISEGDFVPIAHWAGEDGSDATSLASSFSGQPAATITGSVSPAAYSGFPGSQSIPILSNGTISAPFPSYTDTGIWQYQFAIMVPSSGFTNDADMLVIEMAPGGTVATIIVWYKQSAGELQISSLNAAGTTLATDGVFVGFMPRDTPYLLAVSDYTFGGTHNTALSVFDTAGTFIQQTTLVPGGSPGVPKRWTAIATSVSSGWAFGQAAFYTADILSAPNIGPNAQASGGYDGETATDRMIRLCREEGVYLDIAGDTADSAAMGPQRAGKLLDLLFECAEADFGILYEPRDAFGLAYRTRPSLYNQTGLTLDYAASQVFAPFQPTEDDQLIVNDAIARRLNGSWARVTAEAGPLSTDEPPDGVGTYAEDRTYNLGTDSQLLPVAGWRVHVGSWDEARYPQIHVLLHAPAFSASAALTGQAAAVDAGDYLAVDNPPAWLPPDLIELLAQGFRETLRTYEWEITWNAVPAGPYRVFVLDLDRLEGDHALASSVTTSATSWSVKTNSGPLLSTTDTGQQWMVEGELVTVTAVSGAASPQTITVTRNVDGIPGGKAHGADAVVELSPAPYLAL
jgi:hypothetical protein